MDVWGGGGVPADDGPPLGLGWEVKNEHSTGIDEYEEGRSRDRTPKDSYCMEGCVDAEQRRRMLLSAGSTIKQIKAATKAVATLNQERWKVRGNPQKGRGTSAASGGGASLCAVDACKGLQTGAPAGLADPMP